MGSLVMLGRQDIIEKSISINLETMVYQPAEAAAHQQAQAAILAPLLGLSEQQQEYIAVGMQLYFDLVAAIHQQRQQVNSEMTAANEQRPDTTTNSNSRMSDDGSREVGTPTSGSSSERLESLPDTQELLEKQQQLTERLNLLLHKEVGVGSCALLCSAVYAPVAGAVVECAAGHYCLQAGHLSSASPRAHERCLKGSW
jgi:hypothetical protein